MTTRVKSVSMPRKKKAPKSTKPTRPEIGEKEPASKKMKAFKKNFTKGDTIEDAQKKMGITQNRRKRNKGRS